MKPFDPEHDSDALRATLRELAGSYKISSALLLYRVSKFAGANNYASFQISRATLERFRAGEDVTRIEALAVIWDYLQSEALPARIFSESELIVAEMASDQPSSQSQSAQQISPYSAMSSYYSSGRFVHASVALQDCVYQFSGRFMMYHRDWTSPDKIFRSVMQIWIDDTGANILQVVDVANPGSPPTFFNKHEGFMFSRGNFIHFLMREADGAGILFGTFDSFTPFNCAHQVDRITGVLSGSTHQKIIGNRRFYCHRVEIGKELHCDLYDISEIDCVEAKEYISDIS